MAVRDVRVRDGRKAMGRGVRWLGVLVLVSAIVAPPGANVAASASEQSTWTYSGTLDRQASAVHETELASGVVSATITFVHRRERGELQLFGPDGRELFSERSRGSISYSGELGPGVHRWIVTAESSLSYRLEVTGEEPDPTPHPEPVPDPAPDPAPGGDGDATWLFEGSLADRASAAHLAGLAEGPVRATVTFGHPRADGKLSIFDPNGRRVFEQRNKGEVTFSGTLGEGVHRWLVQAYSPLSYRLEVVAEGSGPAPDPDPAPDPGPDPAPDPDPALDPDPDPDPAPDPDPGPDPDPAPAPGGVPDGYTAYYVDAVDGRDDRDGLSPASAWRSLAAVNGRSLRTGSAVLFRGGQTFAGMLAIGTQDGGTVDAPLFVGSYGGGRATIDAGSGIGISVYNRGAVTIEDLRVVGAFSGSADGIQVYSDLPGGELLAGVTLRRVEASGFRGWGVSVGSWAGRSGFRDVLFDGLDLHGNGRGGLLTYAQDPNVHENVRVLRSRAYENPGYPGAQGHTGNGFVLGGVSGGEVGHSLAYRNGGANDVDAEGPVGIWAYNSDRVVIQHNEAFDNRSGSRADGGGFDLDNGTTNSVLQYNYSHGNAGAGFLLWQTGSVPSGGNIVRYNVSENDGRKNGYGGITVGGVSPGSLVHHNTVYTGRGDGAMPAAVAVFDRAEGYRFRNNALMVDGGMPLIATTEAAPSVTFRGNAYHAGSGGFRVLWGRTAHDGLAAWRSATGQERDGTGDLGVFTDPLLDSVGGGGTIGDTLRLGDLDAYRLQTNSPLRGAALSMPTTQRGPRDFYGASVPTDRPADVGAHQAS